MLRTLESGQCREHHSLIWRLRGGHARFAWGRGAARDALRSPGRGVESQIPDIFGWRGWYPSL